MEKSAVEWLYNQLSLNNILLNQGTKAHKEIEQKILEQAKEMHKEEIEKALLTGLVHWNVEKPISEYYNETFKSE